MCLPLFEWPDSKKMYWHWIRTRGVKRRKRNKQRKSLSRTLMQSHMSRLCTLFFWSSVFVPLQQHTHNFRRERGSFIKWHRNKGVSLCMSVEPLLSKSTRTFQMFKFKNKEKEFKKTHTHLCLLNVRRLCMSMGPIKNYHLRAAA